MEQDCTQFAVLILCHDSTGPDSLVVEASASGAGGRRFESQCRRQWVSF